MQTQPYLPAKSTSNSVVLIIAIVLIAILAIGSVFGGLYYLNRNKPPQQTSNLQSVDFVYAPTSLIIGQSVQFTAAVAGGTTPYSYTWNFGDGSYAGTTVSPSHTYNSAGSFMVALTVRDSSNPSSTLSVSHSVTVSSSGNTNSAGLTIAINGPETGTVGNIVTFRTSIAGGTAPFVYSWTATGASPTTGNSDTFDTTYNTVGSYTVRVTVTDANSKTATDSIVVTVNSHSSNLSVRIEGPSTGTAGTMVTFTATASGGSSPYTYAWTALDGSPTTGSGSTFHTTFNVPAPLMEVKVTVSDSYGGSATATAHITISTSSVQSQLPTQLSQWQDPTENAFTTMVPQGWTVRPGSGVVRGNVYLWLPALQFEADKSGMKVFFSFTTTTYIVPSAASLVGCSTVQGSICYPTAYGVHFGGTQIVYNYMTAEQYARNLLCQVLKNDGFMTGDCSSATITTSGSRPDLGSKFLLYVNTKDYLGIDDFTALDATISFTSGGIAQKVAVQLVVTKLTIGGITENWWVDIAGIAAPQSNIDAAANVYSKIIIPSIKISPTWAKTIVQGQAQQSQMISNFNSWMQQMDLQMFREQSNANYQIGRGWANALGGTSDYTDSTGTYTLPSTIPDVNYWYHCGGSDFVGTVDQTAPSTSCTLMSSKT